MRGLAAAIAAPPMTQMACCPELLQSDLTDLDAVAVRSRCSCNTAEDPLSPSVPRAITWKRTTMPCVKLSTGMLQ